MQKYGEAILVLGTRKAESQRRAITMEKHGAQRVRERLVPNASLPNSLVYTPIEDWNNDDVWLYLMQVKNPWGHDNKSLLGMYQGATEGGECPLVVDTSTPSCGTSRFGCWVCTVVDKDRSMEAMIKNDEEKVWMTPLLELRNELGEPDRDKRDFRRMNGSVQLFHDRTDPRPVQERGTRALAPARARSPAERRARTGRRNSARSSSSASRSWTRSAGIWLHEKHEFDDSLPRIYEEVTGEPFPKPRDDGNALQVRRLGLAPGDLRRGRGALRPSGRPARRRAEVSRDDAARRRHRCAGEMPQGGGFQRARPKRSRFSRRTAMKRVLETSEGSQEDDRSRQTPCHVSRGIDA